MRRNRKRRFELNRLLTSLCLCLLVVLTGCSKQRIEPVAINPEDMCNYCKMAISDKRFAAEFIDRDGQALKFDDLGCMLDYIKEKGNKEQVAAHFVMDFDTRQWLKTEDAFFVNSSELHSPMGGNMAAFSDEAKARAAAEKFGGKLLRFNDLLAR